jgi:NAD(P)H dehydrogenase (quinone)
MTEKRTYVITGATGRIGGRVARGLLAAGHNVRALGRNPQKLHELADLGAVPGIGDVRDAAFVEQTFDGADAAFLLVSGDRQVRDFRRAFAHIGENYAAALRARRVPAAIFISTIGAHDEKHRGLILVHGDVEQSLDAVPDLNVLHLRAPAFFENLFYFLRPMRERGVLATPILPDAPLEMASTTDVAATALRLLQALDFHGRRAIELHGPQGLTMRRIAQTIARELGRPFPVEHVARDEDIETLVAMGLGRDFATLLNDTWDVFSRYGLLRGTEPSPSSTAPTSIEDFIRQALVPAIVQGEPLSGPRTPQTVVTG